jgi:hypothetical protein
VKWLEILFTAALLCISCVKATAQSGVHSPLCKSQTTPHLSTGKPSVYIKFERGGSYKHGEEKLAASQELEGDSLKVVEGHAKRHFYWLRLHNNSCWAIRLPTSSLYVGPQTTPFRLSDGRGVLVLKEGLEVSAIYQVEVDPDHRAAAQPPPGTNRSDMSFASWIAPGGSILFAVPRNYLRLYLSIHLRFNYEWEIRGDEPQHRLYFHHWQLPLGEQEKKD